MDPLVQTGWTADRPVKGSGLNTAAAKTLIISHQPKLRQNSAKVKADVNSWKRDYLGLSEGVAGCDLTHGQNSEADTSEILLRINPDANRFGKSLLPILDAVVLKSLNELSEVGKSPVAID